jgi:hypothetical protein
MMLIVALIFLYFMFQTNSIELKDVDAVFSAEAISWLFSSALNISLLLIVVVLY